MNEENTTDLTDSEKLNLILGELAEMRTWRGKVDAFIEDRSRETRPLLGQIQKDIADTRSEMRERFDKVESEMRERFDKVESEMRERFDKVEAEAADTRTEMRERFGQVGERFNKMDEQLVAVRDDTKLTRRSLKVLQEEWIRARGDWHEHDDRLDDLESQVEKLKAA